MNFIMPIREKNFDDLIEWQWAIDDPRLPSPMYTSCYFIDGIIFDTGAPAGKVDFIKWCNSIGREKVGKCILTHAHEDHAGGANSLQNEWQVPIYSSDEAIHILATGYTYPDYRQMAWGEALAPVKTEMCIDPVYSINRKYKFEILPTPGHAPCQLAFLERDQGWLITADAVQPKYRMIFGSTSSIQEDIRLISESIKNLYRWTENVKLLKIFIAGQDLVTGRDFLKTKIEEIESLHIQAHQLAKQGIPEKKMLKELFGGESFIGTMTRGELSRANLLHSLLKWAIN
jgi:glyoxylase-like metal-dependent hydrolase (beta-lactamase superfamily II)